MMFIRTRIAIRMRIANLIDWMYQDVCRADLTEWAMNPEIGFMRVFSMRESADKYFSTTSATFERKSTFKRFYCRYCEKCNQELEDMLS